MSREQIQIRGYQPDDRDQVYRICLQTANNGGDGTAIFRDPRLPGDVYAVPYAIFEPSLTLVAQDAGGVGGYIVATLDSLEFGRRLERGWWPAMRARYPEPSPDLAWGLSVQERTALSNIHHQWKPGQNVPSGYPSHLHINLLPPLQGRGVGRRLIMTLLGRLREAGSPGVHLTSGLANLRAAGFYQHLGFSELAASDMHMFAMDLRDR
jgi:ribosomal protein S18 acetylase RimI-like enzyme